MHEYLFDAKLFASLRIKAQNESEARRKLRGVLECAGVSVTDDAGNVIEFELSLDDEEEANAELIEVDGVDA